jgi:3-oxoadipate enol-lactonase
MFLATILGFLAMSAGNTAFAAVHRIDVGGATLHAEVDGPEGAPAILMWNGAADTTRMWDLVVPRLADRFRVIRFDVRGTGQSTPSESDSQYTLEQYSKDAITLLQHFGYERSIIWSMAWGSRAAIAYAGLHPERVQLLALYDASVGPADVLAQDEGREQALEAQQEAGIPLVDRPPGWNHHLNRVDMRKSLAATSKFENLAGQLPKITAPTLVCSGDFDPNLESSRRIAEQIPDARLEIMKNVGHGSVLQRPDLTTKIFLDFVDEHTHLIG